MATVLQGYKLAECLDRNPLFSLYRGMCLSDGQPVLIKMLTSDLSKPEHISLAVHEYQMTKDLHMDGILRPIRQERHHHLPVQIFEAFDGTLLQHYLHEHRLDVPSFLHIAIQLCQTVSEIHQLRIIHKDIHPGNILIHPQTKEIKLTGFSFATVLSKENQSPVSPYVLEGTIAYLSPEQTGRMNRPLDYRTDVYSLGVTFYEILTGQKPFEAGDPIEWVHAHLTKKPVPVKDVNPDMPGTLSDIVMKMLEKTPESRYQTVYGLQKDLERALYTWQETGQIDPFTLGKADAAAVFEIRPKLYGRENEIDILFNAFDRISEGAVEFVLIPGVSGIGKTALVGEMQKPLVREKGYFTQGKFDQLQRHVPYGPLIQAFKGLIRQILTESDDRVSAWERSLRDNISPNGQVLTDVLPELEWLIGKQSDVQPLPAVEAQNRFHMVFQQFVQAFAKKEHPLVLFLDDLQWADAASLNLIRYLLTHVKSEYLLVIGAYRDNEVGLAHPFTLVLDEIEQAGVSINRIPLCPLTRQHIEHWTSDALRLPVPNVEALSSTIYHITNGNPFYVYQLLDSFYREQQITFDTTSGTWQWNPDNLVDQSFAQDVLAFMVAKVKKLAPRTLAVLKLAACIGNRFDLQTLSIIYEKTPADTSRDLWEALDKGLILPLDPAYKWQYPDEVSGTIDGKLPQYRFLHDRVQQAVYATLSEEERETVHYDIGRLLLKNTDTHEQESRLFEIVNHLNVSLKRFIRLNEKVHLAELNLRAGKQAKDAAAFESALNYFVTGASLLPDDCWERCYTLTVALMLGRGECEYLNGRFQEAEQTFENILRHARSREDKLQVHTLQITLYTHLEQYRDAVEAGMRGLKLFGWKLPSKPGKVSLIPEIAKARWQLGRRKADDLLHLPKMTDRDKRLLMQLLINLNAPTYHYDQNLTSLLMLRAFRFTLQHGHNDFSALTYNNYSLFLSAGFGDLTGSYQFGLLAKKLADEIGAPRLKGRVYFVFGSFVNHWKKHIKHNLNYLEWSQQYSIESGNLHLAGAASSFIVITKLIKGDNVADIITSIDEQLKLANEIKMNLSQDFLTQLRHWLHCLYNPNLDPELEQMRTPEDEAAQVPYYTMQLQMAYLFDRQDLALRIIDKLELLMDKSLVLITGPEYYFYHSLWLTTCVADTPVQQKRRYRVLLKRNLRKMKKWAKHCPENYGHKYVLMAAEYARLKGDERKAATYYEQAIRSATENGYQQNAAIANECAARYFLEHKIETVAKTYLTEAYLGYLKWGAVRKAKALEKSYPEMIMAHARRYAAAAKGEIGTEGLDVLSIVKASQTISGEIVLEQLLKQLMKIVLENAGAERGVLILCEADELFIEASGGIEQDSVSVLQSIPVQDNTFMSLAIVQYVLRTKEAVVLADAVHNGMFTRDPYVTKHQPKSILCMPILSQGELSGILYLENNATTYAFTSERLQVLSLLSAQAAISIENARLYAHLEQKVQERTHALEKANAALEKTNRELARLEQSRRHLLSNISHDLRTPITSIQGYLEAILDGVVEKPFEQKEYLERSYKRLVGLNRMIQDLFDLSQLEAGQMTFNLEVVPVDQLVQQLYRQFEFDVKQAGLTFDLQLPSLTKVAVDGSGDAVLSGQSVPESPLYPLVEVDPGRLEQVFGNLISNAVKHTPLGGHICISVTLEAKGEKGEWSEVLIKVADSGSGITTSDLPHIFERFYSKNKRRKGHGLGLAICKEIIAFHKGRIWAESEQGKGATFCFTLPVYHLDADL